MTKFATPFALLFLFAVTVGCGAQSETTIDSDLDASTIKFERARFVLADEPPDAMTPTDAKELATEPVEMVLAGRIDAGDINPFQAGKATFMISELPDEEHAAGDPDHADNCPFCARRLAKAPKAIVTFNDKDGNAIEIDSQSLFDISKGDAVVVKGTVHYQEATNTLQVDASGLHRRGS